MTASPSPSKMKQRKALETKNRLLWKKPSGCRYNNKTKKVGTDNTKKTTICYERKRNMSMNSTPYACGKSKASAIESAIEVQANLESKFPSFVKPMLPSHVTGGFWLSFPKPFCDQHLPKHDDMVVLVDEDEQAYQTKYLIDKNGLSGGWRGFSIAHKLLEGDVLVFQLIEPCKFKVYIVRVNNLTEIDGAIVLLTFNTRAKPMNIGEKCPKLLLPRDSTQDDADAKGTMVLDTDSGPAADQSGDDSNGFGSEILDGIRFTESIVDFKDVKTIEDFAIQVDGLIIDSEVPTYLKIKYYELCRSKKLFLHDHILTGLNIKLVAGIISETVNIADAIKACNLSTSRDDFEIWDKTLKGFETLGMVVGFLRDRLTRLIGLSFDTQELIESKRLERKRAEEERKSLEAKLFNVKGEIETLDVEIEVLTVKHESRAFIFREEANAPW